MSSEIQEALESFLGKSATLCSTEQKLALMVVLDGESLLIVIFFMGGGKSLLFMLPVWSEGAQTTILICPFIALANNMEADVRKLVSIAFSGIMVQQIL